jgi:uncharacterized protein (TIGR04255 family)
MEEFPNYKSPPVIEVILGVQFEPIAAFRNAHLGAFWKSLDLQEWSLIQDVPPLEPTFERFGEQGQWGGLGLNLRLSQDSSSRLQIKNATTNRMIQVQNGRLHFNWLGEGGNPYDRYPVIRAGFEQALQQFQQFLTQEKLGHLRPNQWEVTYLNHIPKGTVWNAVEDWRFCLLIGNIPTYQDLIEPESFRADWHFTIPNQRGRLHVQWQHAQRSTPDTQEIVVLNLTARGPLGPEGIGVDEVLSGIDLGRQTIVQTFPRIMSDKANAFWGINHANG